MNCSNPSKSLHPLPDITSFSNNKIVGRLKLKIADDKINLAEKLKVVFEGWNTWQEKGEIAGC